MPVSKALLHTGDTHPNEGNAVKPTFQQDWPVKSIKDHRWTKETIEYLVEWEGPYQDTWEPDVNVDCCTELLRNYRKAHCESVIVCDCNTSAVNDEIKTFECTKCNVHYHHLCQGLVVHTKEAECMACTLSAPKDKEIVPVEHFENDLWLKEKGIFVGWCLVLAWVMATQYVGIDLETIMLAMIAAQNIHIEDLESRHSFKKPLKRSQGTDVHYRVSDLIRGLQQLNVPFRMHRVFKNLTTASNFATLRHALLKTRAFLVIGKAPTSVQKKKFKKQAAQTKKAKRKAKRGRKRAHYSNLPRRVRRPLAPPKHLHAVAIRFDKSMTAKIFDAALQSAKTFPISQEHEFYLQLKLCIEPILAIYEVTSLK